MIKTGEYNTLKVVKDRDFGIFLADREGNEVLIPKSILKNKELKIGEEVEAFIFLDSTNRQVATLEKPFITVGEVGYLEVVSTSDMGAFLYNGIGRDLFLPMREQKYKPLKGKKYLVYGYLDKTGRMAATTDIDDYLDMMATDACKVNDMVRGIAYARSGGETLKIAIDGKYRGIILGNEHDEVIYPGEEIEARVKRIYEDGTIGLSTRKKRLDARGELEEKIILHLKRNGGFMEFNDKSKAEDIRETFKTSKNYFKMALGGLMKKGKIEQSAEGTKLL